MVDAGRTVAGYRVERRLGSGGMGAVYEATQLSLDRVVALKVLSPTLSADAGFRERFRREAMLQAALEHPNIVPVYEAGESEAGLFMAMKLVDGADLKRLAAGGDLAPERVLALLTQVAAALDAAHASGLVHRDVKPQNILVDGERAYLADFGLTKGAGDRGTTLTGQYLGSLDYTPPEQIRGEPVGPAGDLYALTAVLYEALTGEVPFPHENEAALLYAHVAETPPRPSERRAELPRALDGVVARGLAKRPEDRYRSAAALVDAARSALASPPASAVDTNGGGTDRGRFGETIADPAVLRAAPVVDVAPEREIPWRAIAVAALVVAALALAGFALGRLTRGGDDQPRGVATAGRLSVSFPDGSWAPAAAPAIPGLGLQGAVALRSTEEHRPGTVVLGLAPRAQGAGLLPPTLRRQLSGSPPADVVRVGPAEGLFYRDLPATLVRSRIDLLLVPTRAGAAAVACLTPRVLRSGDEPADCGEVAATLRLHGLRALPLGDHMPYTHALAAELARLDGERLAARRQLAGAATRPEQRRAAASLAAAYAATAEGVLRIRPTPFARPSHLALYGALRQAQRRAAALSAAARAGDEAAYARAATRLDAAEQNVAVSIRRLQRLRLP
jgi:predicted Ser/Thr protein kinase